MKRILYLSFILFLISFSDVAAQNDTVVINNPQKVTIIYMEGSVRSLEQLEELLKN